MSKKIILNLLLKLFMSISDQRGNNKKEHLSFFFTTTFNNDNSFSLVFATLSLHKARSNQCQHLNNYAPSPPRSYPTTVN